MSAVDQLLQNFLWCSPVNLSIYRAKIYRRILHRISNVAGDSEVHWWLSQFYHLIINRYYNEFLRLLRQYILMENCIIILIYLRCFCPPYCVKQFFWNWSSTRWFISLKKFSAAISSSKSLGLVLVSQLYVLPSVWLH